jgi:uncharacterized membrane protein YccC
MDPDNLRSELGKLRAELDGARPADPRVNELRDEMLAHIERVLGASAPLDGSLADRLEKAAVQFEADHPTLAASSRRLIDFLGKAGV